MARKAFKCRSEVTLHCIRSPGTWLPNRDDLYITVELLGAVKRSRLLLPIFPAHINDKLVFERTFWSPVDPQEVLEMLEDLPVSIELRQVTDVYLGGTLLAYYDSNARDFLYPLHSRTGTAYDNEALMNRTVDFPGVSPRLEFSTHTIIDELPSAYGDGLGDYDVTLTSSRGAEGWERRLDSQLARGRSKTRTRSSTRAADLGSRDYARKTVTSVYRSRSPSPSDRLRTSAIVRRARSPTVRRSTSALNVSERPPFVVKRVSPRLLSRSPTYYDNYYDFRSEDKSEANGTKDRSRPVTPNDKKRKDSQDKDGQGAKVDKENYNSEEDKRSSDDKNAAVENGTASRGRGGSEKLSDTEKSKGKKRHAGKKAAVGTKGDELTGTDSYSDYDKEVDKLTSHAPLTQSLSNLSIRERYSPILDTQLDRIRQRVDDVLWRNRLYPYNSLYYPRYPYLPYDAPYYWRHRYYGLYDPWWTRRHLY